MKRLFIFGVLAAAFANSVQAQEPMILPSGLEGHVFEEKQIEHQRLYVGIVVPKLPSISFETALSDLDHICFLYLAQLVAPKPTEIVIRVMDAELDYADADPDINQFMSFYSVLNNTCEWQ